MPGSGDVADLGNPSSGSKCARFVYVENVCMSVSPAGVASRTTAQSRPMT